MKKHLQFLPVFLLLLVSQLADAQCQPPTNLSATYNNNVSTFSWNAVPGAQGYFFEIKLQWDPWGSGYGLTLTDTSTDFTGLFHTAPLDWRVSTDCGNGSISTPTTSFYSTPCPIASNPVVSNITGTTVTLSWTAPAGYNTNTTNFSVGYRIANSNNAWTSAGSTSATTKNITGLSSGTAYEFCINTSCMYANSSPLLGTFTTAYVACDIPLNLSITNATSNQALVSWSHVNGWITYTLEYKNVNSNVWIPVYCPSNNKLLTGLASATLYDVRVKANCNTASSGYISTQFTTYTATCPAWGINGSEYLDLFELGSISRTSGREVGGYINTNLLTNLGRGTTTTGQFSVGYNPGIVFGENVAVYIDFNNNGSFNDPGEMVVSPIYVVSGANNNFSLTIPSNTTKATRNMRVVVARSTAAINPCATNFKGEVEDYKVKIVNATNRMGIETEEDDDDIKVEKNIPSVSAYPNPSSGIFNIQLPGNSNAIYYEIMNSNGIIIEKKNIGSRKSLSIDLSNHAKGMYIVNLIDNNNKKYSLKLNLIN